MYSASEFEVICVDLQHAAQLGAAGVVCGILHPDNTVDKQRTASLVGLAGPMEVTFHRAFDQTPNLLREPSKMRSRAGAAECSLRAGNPLQAKASRPWLLWSSKPGDGSVSQRLAALRSRLRPPSWRRHAPMCTPPFAGGRRLTPTANRTLFRAVSPHSNCKYPTSGP